MTKTTKTTKLARTGTIRINGATIEVEIKGKSVRFPNGTEQCSGCGENIADSARWFDNRLAVGCACGADYSVRS